MPKSSVIIPCYNHAAFIEAAIRSVLAQSEPDLELIVIDDGSTDNSAEVIASIVDPRLRLLRQPNRGAHAAINRGLQESKGQFLAILNSDDLFHPQRLEKAIALLEANPMTGLVGSYIEIIDAQGKPLGVKHGYDDCPPWLLPHPERSFRAQKDLRAALLTENYWATTSNYVFRRSCYEQVGEFLPLRFAHDWDFVLRLSRLAELALIPEALISYRVHSSNTIRQDKAAMIYEICWILAVHLPAQTGEPWFTQQPLGMRTDLLLQSIYTYGMDKALSLLLLQGISANPAAALRLLEPGDATRKVYIEFIQDELARQEAAARAAPATAIANSAPVTFAKRVRRFLARILGR